MFLSLSSTSSSPETSVNASYTRILFKLAKMSKLWLRKSSSIKLSEVYSLTFLFSDKILYGWMYQYVMGICLFTLFLKWVIVTQTQISIQLRKFFLYSTDQSFIRTPSCTSHKFIPSFDANTTTICFVIHRHLSYFFHFPYFENISLV